MFITSFFLSSVTNGRPKIYASHGPIKYHTDEKSKLTSWKLPYRSIGHVTFYSPQVKHGNYCSTVDLIDDQWDTTGENKLIDGDVLTITVAHNKASLSYVSGTINHKIKHPSLSSLMVCDFFYSVSNVIQQCRYIT